MSKKNKASKSNVQEKSTIEETLQQDATAQTALAVATSNENKVSAAKAHYLALASTHPKDRLQHEGETFVPKNKGALMAALWYAVCTTCGYTETKRYNAAIGNVVGKLAAHAVTHCASKGKPLAGAEVSDNGAVGYARALKGALTGATDQHSIRFSQYLLGGKYYNKCEAENKLATMLVKVYGATEGIEGAKRALSAVSV